MTEQGPELLQQALRAALEAAGRGGQIQVSSQKALEATWATLDEKLGADPSGESFDVVPAPDSCLVVVHSSDPVAHDVVATFLHQGGASRLGSAMAWLLPLAGLPVTRWARALRRVVAATRRKGGGDAEGCLPMRLTIVWSQDGELTIASLG
jgi:type II secretory pathway component GspD/PulD (secretin)